MLKPVIILSLVIYSALTEPHTFEAPLENASGPKAALVWIQGALVPASKYKPLLRSVQEAAVDQLTLWTGSPSFLLDTPEPVRLDADIRATLKLMYDAGMPEETPLYFGGHSLGTVFIQTWCTDNPDLCRGLILGGGFLARTNFLPHFKFAGEGLSRYDVISFMEEVGLFA